MNQPFILPQRQYDSEAKRVFVNLVRGKGEHAVCFDASYDVNGLHETPEKWTVLSDGIRVMLNYLLVTKQNIFLLTEPNWFIIEVGHQLLKLREQYPLKLYVVCRSCQPFTYHYKQAAEPLREAYIDLCGQADCAFGINKASLVNSYYGELLAKRSKVLVCCYYKKRRATNNAVMRFASYYGNEIFQLFADKGETYELSGTADKK